MIMRFILTRLTFLLLTIGVSYGLVFYTSDGRRLLSSIKQKTENKVEVNNSLTDTRVFEVVNQWRMDNNLRAHYAEYHRLLHADVSVLRHGEGLSQVKEFHLRRC